MAADLAAIYVGETNTGAFLKRAAPEMLEFIEQRKRTVMTLPYPPPFQDLATLAQHVCMSERTIEEKVREGGISCTAQK